MPGHGQGRIGIIQGNAFTPVTVPDNPDLGAGLAW
jgi:hypothetical protein